MVLWYWYRGIVEKVGRIAIDRRRSRQVCSIRVMAAPPPIDSLPQPQPERGPPHATREKSISYDQRSLTTLPTSGFRGLYEAHCEFVVYIDDRSWAGGFLRNFSFFAAIVSHVVTHDWLTNTW